MEQNKVRFTIMCNDDKYLIESLEWYNSIHKTDFEIEKLVLDEVNFIEIAVSKFTLTDIFNIGYAFGVKEQKLRFERKIDW